MAVWRLKIFLHVLKISQGSTDFSETTAYLDKGEIYYVAVVEQIFPLVQFFLNWYRIL